MNKLNAAHKVAMILGVISIIAGIYMMAKGRPMNVYGFNLFIGITLFGTALINHNRTKKDC